MLVDKNDPAALEFETKIHSAQILQRASNRFVAIRRRVEQQKSSGPRAQQFAPDRTGFARLFVPRFDPPRRNIRHDALLQTPAFVDDFTHRCRTVLLQFALEVMGQYNHSPHDCLLFGLGADRALLVFQNVGSTARNAGVKNQAMFLQLADRLALANQRLHRDGVVLVELDEIESPKGGGILVLFADGFATAVDLHHARFPRELVRAHMPLPVRVQRMQQSHRERTGTAKPGPPRRNVRNRSNLNPAINPQQSQTLTHQRMPNALNRPGLLSPGITHPDFFIELLVHRHIHILVDGGGNDRAPKPTVEHRQITATTDKTHAQGCSTDNHTIVFAKIMGVASSRLSATKSGFTANLPSLPAYPVLTSTCLLYTSPSPRDRTRSRMPSSA